MAKVKLISEDAKVPTRGSKGSSGWDLYCIEDFTLRSQGRCLINTGVTMEIPSDCYGRIAPRSGLALKGINVLGGVVDSDYRGEIKVILHNCSDIDHEFKKHDRIAQIIFTKINTEEIIVVDKLDETVRGGAGFGSSGK